MSNYPPGVTGNEPQISGTWPPCTNCDHDADEHADHWGTSEDELGIPRGDRCMVENCTCVEYGYP